MFVRELEGTAVLGTTSCWYCPSFDQSNKLNDPIQLYNSSYIGIKIRSSVQVLQKPLQLLFLSSVLKPLQPAAFLILERYDEKIAV